MADLEWADSDEIIADLRARLKGEDEMPELLDEDVYEMVNWEAISNLLLNLIDRITELERVVGQMGPPYLDVKMARIVRAKR